MRDYYGRATPQRNPRLIKAREEFKLTQGQAAWLMGIRRGYLDDLENGTRFGSVALAGVSDDDMQWGSGALKVAAFYGHPLEYLWPKEARELRRYQVAAKISREEASAPFFQETVETPWWLKRLLKQYLDQLLPRTRFVLMKRLGEDATLTELGEILGVQHERVRQIEREGLWELRRYLAPAYERAEACLPRARPLAPTAVEPFVPPTSPRRKPPKNPPPLIVPATAATLIVDIDRGYHHFSCLVRDIKYVKSPGPEGRQHEVLIAVVTPQGRGTSVPSMLGSGKVDANLCLTGSRRYNGVLSAGTGEFIGYAVDLDVRTGRFSTKVVD